MSHLHVLLSDIVVFFLAKEIFRYRAENIYSSSRKRIFRNTYRGIFLTYDTLIYKEILYIHINRYSKYRAMGIYMIPHTLEY
jgi:hypothetical protein